MTAVEFKQRFLPCHRQLFALACQLMGRAEDAEDMVQEAYLKLWSLRDKLPQDAAEAYCLRVVRNVCIDQLRARHLSISTDDEQPKAQLSTPDTPANEAERRDEAAMVMHLMERLPAQQRLVMTLHDVQGCDYNEVTQVTGLTEVNARVLLSRARKSIREQLLRMNKR